MISRPELHLRGLTGSQTNSVVAENEAVQACSAALTLEASCSQEAVPALLLSAGSNIAVTSMFQMSRHETHDAACMKSTDLHAGPAFGGVRSCRHNVGA